MSRRTSERPPVPPGGPTLTEVELHRFCVALLDWDGVHVVGEERFGKTLRVLLTDEADHEEWCHSLDACVAFRDRYGEQV